MKEKLRSKSFWMSLIGALLVFAQAVGLKFDIPAVNEIIRAGLTLLVVIGIITGDGGRKSGGEDGETEGSDGTETDVEGETSDGGAASAK